MKTLKTKPCPCCGNTKLYVGTMSSMTQGVSCWRYNGGCGLRLEVGYPVTTKLSVKACERRVLGLAVAKWNKRVV